MDYKQALKLMTKEAAETNEYLAAVKMFKKAQAADTGVPAGAPVEEPSGPNASFEPGMSYEEPKPAEPNMSVSPPAAPEKPAVASKFDPIYTIVNKCNKGLEAVRYMNEVVDRKKILDTFEQCDRDLRWANSSPILDGSTESNNLRTKLEGVRQKLEQAKANKNIKVDTTNPYLGDKAAYVEAIELLKKAAK